MGIRVADTTVWPQLAGGCHTATGPVAAIKTARFEITTFRAAAFPEVRFAQPSTPHVLRTAHAPAELTG